jgi:hypothetical protein
MDAAVQTFENKIECFESNPRKSPGQRVRADKHYRPNRGGIKWIADSDGVAQNYVPLKLLDLLAADDLVFEGPEARSDPLGNFATFEQRINRSLQLFEHSFLARSPSNTRGSPGLAVRGGKHLLKR